MPPLLPLGFDPKVIFAIENNKEAKEDKSTTDDGGPKSRDILANIERDLSAICGNAFESIVSIFRNPLARRDDDSTAEAGFKARLEEDPEDPTALHGLAYEYFQEGDYKTATEIYETAVEANADPVTARGQLGRAYFSTGDYAKSFENYSRYLEDVSRDPQVRALRMEAGQKYLETLDEESDAAEIARVQKEMLSDKAMLLALNADKERESIKNIGRQLSEARPESPEAALKILDQVRTLALSYQALGTAAFSGKDDAEFVREELRALAGDVFQAMCSFSNDSVYEDIKRLTPLYEGYYLLSQDEETAAREKMTPFRSEFPEVEAIFKKMESDELGGLNLAALDVWENVLDQNEAARTGHSDMCVAGSAEYQNHKKLIVEIRRGIREGKYATVKEAMADIGDNGPDEFREFVQDNLKRTRSSARGGGDILPHLIEYASTLEPTAQATELLFDDAQRTEGEILTGSYGVYCFLHSTSHDSKIRDWSKSAADEITRKKGPLETFFKTVLAVLPTSPDDLVMTVAGLGLAQKVGALTKLAALGRLAKAGVSGQTALRLAMGAEILAEGHVLFAFNTAHQVGLHGLEALDPSRLAVSYGTTLLMLGVLKPSINLGKKLGPQIARGLGLVEEGGAKLSKAGEAVIWATAHTFGFGGMVASTQANQILGLAARPAGGFAESFAADLVGYIKYGTAGKLFDLAVGPKAVERSRQTQQEIAVREASLTAEGHLKKMGYVPSSRSASGEPVFETPAAQRLHDQLTSLSLAVPGFDGGKFATLVADGKLTGAADYLRGFGLKMAVANRAPAGFEPLSLHEQEGVIPDAVPTAARQAKPAEPLSETLPTRPGLKIVDPQPTDVHDTITDTPPADTIKDFSDISQQEQARLAIDGIEYVYNFLDGLRREHKMGEPTSPVKVLEATPDYAKEGITLAVKTPAEGEKLLDDIAAHADNLGGQKIIPMTVRSREPGSMVLETPSGRPVKVTIRATESGSQNSLLPPAAYATAAPGIYGLMTSLGAGAGVSALVAGASVLLPLVAGFFSRGGKPGEVPTAASGELPVGQTVSIKPTPGKTFSVGRAGTPGLDLAFDSQHISGNHFSLVPVGDRWVLVDGAPGAPKTSLNGVSINGQRMTNKWAPIAEGDRIEACGTTFVFHDPHMETAVAAKAAKPENWSDRKDNWKGIAAASNKGLYYKETNEDRYVVLAGPDGRSLMVAIDGMGGHAGGERAAEIARRAIEKTMFEGKSAAEALKAADAAIIRDNQELGLTQDAPGAVAMAVELTPQTDGTYRATFTGVGDCEAIVIRPGASQPILHHTMRANALSMAVREGGGKPYKTLADGRLALGQTLDLRMDPFANRVDSALGGHDAKIDTSVTEKPLRNGDIILTGSDGLFENFGRLDIIQEVIRQSGATTAAEIRDALMTEALIRMSLAENAFDKVLSHRDYVAAYRDATGREPASDWRGMYEPWRDASGQYHSYQLDKKGVVSHVGSGRPVDHFKNDNVTLAVQIVGQPVHQAD